MTLALRRTVFADGEQRADDYEIRHDGRPSAGFTACAAPAESCGGGRRSGWRNRRTARTGWPIAWTRPRRRSGRRASVCFRLACGLGLDRCQAAQEDDMRGRGSEKSDAGVAGALLRPRSYFLDFS
jgi:hypothetical protein